MEEKKFIQFTSLLLFFSFSSLLFHLHRGFYSPFRLVFFSSRLKFLIYCSFIVHFYYHLRYESLLCLCLSLSLSLTYSLLVWLLDTLFIHFQFLFFVFNAHFSVIRFGPPSKVKCFFLLPWRLYYSLARCLSLSLFLVRSVMVCFLLYFSVI